jgi:hypothetical protein
MKQQGDIDPEFKLHLDSKRELQSETAQSKCFCPLDATINELAPEPDLVKSELDTSARTVEPSYNVGGVQEVEAVECAVKKSEFQTSMSIDMMADRDAIQSVGSDLAKIIQDTYNELALLYCDSFFRRVTTVQVESLELDAALDETILKESECGLFRANFILQGQCRGCSNNTSLLDLDFEEERGGRGNRNRNNRRSLQLKDLDHLGTRRLERSSFFDDVLHQQKFRDLQEDGEDQTQEEDEEKVYCFCTTDTIAERAPTEAEFFAALEEAIGDSVTGSAICDFYGIMEEGRTTPPSSCNLGTNPCRLATNLFTGLDSCNDDRSCANSDGLLAGANACVGVQACRSSLGLTVNDGGCHDFRSCYNMKDSDVGENSCNDYQSCWGISNADIAPNTCSGDFSCSEAFQSSSSRQGGTQRSSIGFSLSGNDDGNSCIGKAGKSRQVPFNPKILNF